MQEAGCREAVEFYPSNSQRWARKEVLMTLRIGLIKRVDALQLVPLLVLWTVTCWKTQLKGEVLDACEREFAAAKSSIGNGGSCASGLEGR
jgi:hypothetical protein